MKKWIALALVFAGVASQSASAQGFSFYTGNRGGGFGISVNNGWGYNGWNGGYYNRGYYAPNFNYGYYNRGYYAPRYVVPHTHYYRGYNGWGNGGVIYHNGHRHYRRW